MFACSAERSENVTDGNADMNANRKSDGPIVPAKRANKTGTPVAESAEERGSPKGNAASHVSCIGHCAGICKASLQAATAGRDDILTVIPEGGAV